jgi:hypothetical protein
MHPSSSNQEFTSPQFTSGWEQSYGTVHVKFSCTVHVGSEAVVLSPADVLVAPPDSASRVADVTVSPLAVVLFALAPSSSLPTDTSTVVDPAPLSSAIGSSLSFDAQLANASTTHEETM